MVKKLRSTVRLPQSLFKFGRLAILCLASIQAGCNSPPGEVSQVQSNLSWLSAMYGMYLGQHKGIAPKTIDDLRKFVEKKTSAEELARLGAANVNDLFVSQRDGKPFVMVSYNKLPAIVGGEHPPVVLYEAEGQNGQKVVAFLGSGTRTVDDSELQKLLSADAKPRQ